MPDFDGIDPPDRITNPDRLGADGRYPKLLYTGSLEHYATRMVTDEATEADARANGFDDHAALYASKTPKASKGPKAA